MIRSKPSRYHKISMAGNAFIADVALSHPVGYVLFQYQFYLMTSGLGRTQVSIREAVKQSLICQDQSK